MSSLKALLSAPATNALGEVTWDDKDTSSTWLRAGVPVSQSTYSALYAKYGLLGKTTVTFWQSGSCTVNSDPFTGIAASSSTALMVGRSGKVRSSSDGIVWTTRSSASPATNFSACTYENGLFVIVGETGVINTSTDAVTWTRRSVASANQINAVAYGGGLYVLAGDNEIIATSTNAITWTLRSTSLGSTSDFYGITYGNGEFIIVGNSGSTADTSILTSADGITWTVRSPSVTSRQLNAVTYGNNLYVAVGEVNVIMTSTNAITWTTRSPATGMASQNYASVTYAEGVYLLSGASGVSTHGLVAYSTDAITWSLRSVPPQSINIDSSFSIYALGYFKGKFLYGGFGYDPGAKVYVSTFGYSNLFNYDPTTQFVGPSTSPVVTNSPSNIYVKGV